MITQLSALDTNQTYSYADYLTWQFDEFVELIKGKIFAMSPAPYLRNQRISGYIHAEIHYYLRKKTCEVFHAPFDVRLLTNKYGQTDKDIYTVVQPDICVVCDKSKLDRRGCIGAPDLVIEIVSKSSWILDKWTKKDLYEEMGVKEFWLVFPNDNIVEVYTIADLGLYGKPQVYTEEDSITTSLFPDFSLSLAEAFREL